MSGGSDQQRWQGDTSQRTNRASPPAAPALPGIATFLQQPHSINTQQQRSSYHPFPANSDHALRQQQQRQQHHRYQQPQQYDSGQEPPTAAGFASYTRLLDSSAGYQRTPHHSPTNSNKSVGSPNLSTFKNIAINSNAASRHHSYDGSSATAGKALNEYPISTSTSSAPARMHVNYKPNVRKSSGGTHHRPLTRTSRYLREVDRRNILRRIEQGEKQANLAKEYQVSRAAISNLKQRHNRKDSQRDGTEGDSEEKGESESDTGSFHHQQQQRERQPRQQEMEQFTPERTGSEPSPIGHLSHGRQFGRTSSFTGDLGHGENYQSERDAQPVLSPPPPSLSPLRLASPPSQEQRFRLVADFLDRVIQVNDAATIEILLARLVTQHADPRSLQMTYSRIARLLLEHAMSIFPTREIEIPVPLSSGSTSRSQPSVSSYLGVDFVKPTCAVSVSNRQEQAAEAVLLQEFRVIEPFSETGSVSFVSASPSTTSTIAEDCAVQLPQNIRENSILVLVDTLSSRSVQEVATAIQAILRSGGQQRDVCLVSICGHEHALAYLLEVFPQLRIATGKMLPRSDPSSNDMLEFVRARLSFQ